VNKTRIAGLQVDGKAMPDFIRESIREGSTVAGLEKVMAVLAEQTESADPSLEMLMAC
jgi:hypothetical protein